MRFSIARSLSLATLVSGLALFVLVPGCSQQSEGERCGDDDFGTTGSDDCGDGLVCTDRALLLNSGDANRCCYPGPATDSRCQLKTGAAAGGAGGGAGTSTSGGAGIGGGDVTGTGGGDVTAEAGSGGEGG